MSVKVFNDVESVRDLFKSYRLLILSDTLLYIDRRSFSIIEDNYIRRGLSTKTNGQQEYSETYCLYEHRMFRTYFGGVHLFRKTLESYLRKTHVINKVLES